jgi:hypothetical protein
MIEKPARPRLDGRIISEWIVGKYGAQYGLNSTGSG